jgi:exodeoxyribonuclease VII large subunit
MPQSLLSVGEFMQLVNETLALIPQGSFTVEGEVCEYKISQNQWITWTLKDEKSDAKLNCFATVYNKRIPVLQDGFRVRVTGYAKVAERFSKFSLNIDTVELVGEGALQKAYEALKKRLEAEGLFDTARKRTLPFMPERIGLITSREAAAYGDFLRVLGNRMGGFSIMHQHVHVQGKEAVDDIVQAFAFLNALPVAERPQVIVLTRGGGSMEELHAFNSEQVARAVFSSIIPVVVGVGHERDETLCDFVADVRASTPSNAAERLAPTRDELQRMLDGGVYRCEERLRNLLLQRRHLITHACALIDHTVTKYHIRVERARDAAQAAMAQRVTLVRSRLEACTRVLASVDPKRVLARGYAIVRSRGKLVVSPSDLTDQDMVNIETQGGTFSAAVQKNHATQTSLL